MTEDDQRSFLLMDERENLQVNLNLLVQLLVIHVNNVTSYCCGLQHGRQHGDLLLVKTVQSSVLSHD